MRPAPTPPARAAPLGGCSLRRRRLRRIGKSKRGRPARTKTFFLRGGKRYSVLGPFVLDAGFLDSCIVEGAFNSETFLQALHQCVVRRPLPRAGSGPSPAHRPAPLEG